jgi:alpha-N-arabinofuranosidase
VGLPLPKPERYARLLPAGMVTPLSYALLLHELFRHSDMVAASCPTGGLYTLLFDNTGEAVGFSAEGLVMKIFATHLAGALPLAISGNSPQQPMSGTPFVDIGLQLTGSPTYPLDVVVALSADRGTFILSVVNPTEESHEFTHRISGIRLHGPGKLWQIAPPGVNAVNETGKEPAVKIVETPQETLPVSIKLPPISINVYQFDIEQA